MLYVPLTGSTILKSPALYTAPVFSSVAVKMKLIDTVLQQLITRTTITLTITANQKGFIFYTVANKRIPLPEFPSLHSPSSNYTLSFSNPIYGVNYIRKTSLTTEFKISDLTPGIDYEIYFYIMNMNLVNQPLYSKISFFTLQP